MDEERGDVVDRKTGLPRLLNQKCTTCVYRPGNLMWLREGRRDQMEQDSNDNGSWITCHKTLPAAGQEIGTQAICRGFWDVNKTNSWGCRLAIVLGGPVEVEEPK